MHYPLDNIIKLAEIDPKDASLDLIFRMLRINNIEYFSELLSYEDSSYDIVIFSNENETSLWRHYKTMIEFDDFDSFIKILRASLLPMVASLIFSLTDIFMIWP